MNEKPPIQKSNKSSSGFIRMRDTSRVASSISLHTRVVGLLKWILPAFVVVVLATLFIWPIVRSHNFGEIVAKAIPNLVVDNLRVTGATTKDELYTITAKRALQVPSLKGAVDLESPEGTITLSDGYGLAGKADKGRYDQNQRTLWLGGGVEISYGRGYRFTTEGAQFDLNQSTASGEQPVVIQGDFGEVSGEGFRVLDGGKVVVVTGRSKARLNLHTSGPSGTKKQ